MMKNVIHEEGPGHLNPNSLYHYIYIQKKNVTVKRSDNLCPRKTDWETEGDCSRTPSQQQQQQQQHCPHCHLLILNEVFVIDRNTLSTFSSRPVQTSVQRAQVGFFWSHPSSFQSQLMTVYSQTFPVTSLFPTSVVLRWDSQCDPASLSFVPMILLSFQCNKQISINNA